MTKQEIRKQIKQIFLDKKEIELNRLSNDICKKILSSREYTDASFVFVYMALQDEVDLKKIIEKCIEDKKNVYIPKIESKSDCVMNFYMLDKSAEIVKQTYEGSYGIQEPCESNIKKFNKEMLKDKKALILVPGRAFTADGKRLGRGKGFYDKFLYELKDNKNIIVAGVCYSFQILQSLPSMEHDIVMDTVYY